ncbi:MAG: OmpH family outer membrane protein [Alphaproteobacteria bacterium]|nr:OmpH family outer membrane protein [Alphaproteobacteria bacterium]
MRLTLLFFFLFNASFALADELKIGYIDVDTVINNISKYEKDNKKLISNFEPKKLELIDLFNHIEILKKQYLNEENSFNSSQNQNRIKNISQLEIDFQKETEAWQNKLNIQKQLLLQEIETLINQSISQLANEENFDLILYDSAAFVSDQINITNKIIKMIESNLK